MPRKEIFEIWQESGNVENIFNSLTTRFSLHNITDESRADLKRKLNFLTTKLKARWLKSTRNKNTFLTKNENWLNNNFVCNCSIKVPLMHQQSTNAGGASKKDFEDCCRKTKRKKVQDLLNSKSKNELVFAAAAAVRDAGKRDAADIINEVSSSPASVSSQIKCLKANTQKQRSFTKEEALAMFIDCKLTKHTYNLTRTKINKLGYKIYPSYYKLRQCKNECYPNISVTESRAVVKVQSIVDITAKRLVLAQAEVLERFTADNFILICKWGGDGSSNHSKYKQKFESDIASDEFLFAFSFVPLQLSELNNQNNLAWYNSIPSSTRNCRPLALLFSKENADNTREETDRIQSEIDSLVPTKIVLGNKTIVIHYKFLLTMVDGKVCNAITRITSSQTCYICGATPKLMNDISNDSSKTNKKNFEFGLSPLHLWIRCFECFLHISYRLGFKKWSVRNKKDKEQFTASKINIQRKFKEEMGLIVDQAKPGYGSTNDGNSARRFFKNYEQSAAITGIDQNLLLRFYIILCTLSSGHDINILKYKRYVEETKELYLSLYSWYYMPVTVHKLLVHSTEIIEYCILPIGMLSEEAQESRNKDLRRFREFHTRKCSRISTNTDLLNMLILTSDPLINVFRESSKKNRKSLPSDALKLLKPPNYNNCDPLQSNSEDEANYSSTSEDSS